MGCGGSICIIGCSQINIRRIEYYGMIEYYIKTVIQKIRSGAINDEGVSSI